MSLRSVGDNKRRTRNSTVKFNSAKDRVRDAVLATLEPLESRQLLTAVVAPIAPELDGITNVSQIDPTAMHGKTYYVNGQGGSQWNDASAVTPYTTNDLVLNVAPFDSNYSACCEGGSGTAGAVLMTNGLTQTQTGAAPSPSQPAVGDGGVSDPSNSQNVLSDLSGSWYESYHLGTAGGASANSTGYDVSEIDIISGHQDYRTQMTDDIMVQYVNSTDWVSLSNGSDFVFNRVPGGGLNKGSAQMAIVNPAGGAIATNVANLKFVAVSDITWFRELVVTGTASGAIGAASAPTVTSATFNTNTAFIDVGMTNNATGSSNNPAYYQIQRATTPNGPWVQVGFAAQQNPGSTFSFTDQGAQPAHTYYYRALAYSLQSGSYITSTNVAGPVSTPASNVEVHYYNQSYWEGPVTLSGGAIKVDFNWGGSPVSGTIRPSSNSTVFTGKITAPTSGIYTFESNTDDDGYLYVDGVLVSEDPGGHGQELPTSRINQITGQPWGSIFPISLVGGQSYNYVFFQNQGGGGSGAHLEWVTPTMTQAGQTSPQVIQPVGTALNPTLQILTGTMDAPAAPTNLVITNTSSNSVDFTFTGNSNAVVFYILQRSADNGGTWTTVNQIEPGSNKTGFNFAPNSSVNMKIQDGSVIPGQSYLYRVAAINYDGSVHSPSASTPILVSAPNDLSNPTATATTSLTSDTNGLTAGTYFIQYTWLNSANQETAPSTEQAVTVTSPSDIVVTVPGGTNVIGSKVYVSNASGQELFYGSPATGQNTVTINSLPAPSAAAVPTASGVGLAPGNYYVEYSWLGSNGQGETAAGGENVGIVGSNQDLTVTVPAAPAGASGANVYIGNASGGETFVGTIGSAGGVMTFNRLPSGGVAAPTYNGTFNIAASGTTTSPVIVNPVGTAANVTTTDAGLEARYYNQELIDPNNLGGAHNNDKYAVALNGLVSEYVKISQNAFAGQDSLGGTWLFAGGIDFNWSAQATAFNGANGSTNSPDASLYPDVERIANTDQTSLFTGQIVPNQTGVYTIISNSDDDGFLWIDDKLVSADPGGHGQEDSTNTRTRTGVNNVPLNNTLIPVTLQAGQHYNFVYAAQERGGGSGAHLKWIEPVSVTGKVVTSNNCTNQNGATITLDGNAQSTDGYYNGYTIQITGGTGSGEAGVITAYNGTSHQAVVNVTNGGNSLLWNPSAMPDSSSSYAIAWAQGIPLYGAGTTTIGHNGAGEGLLQHMSIPHHETMNSNGTVGDTGVNFNDPNTSAAGKVTITNIDPNNGVTLSWTDQSASELWWEIQRSSDGGTNWSTVGKTPMVIGTTFTDPTAGNAYNNPAVSYTYRVRGVNFDGQGPWSNTPATNNLAPAPTPSINSVVQGDPGTIGLTFGGQYLLGGGFELQQIDLTTDTSGGTAWTDVTRNPLPAGTFDYLVSGLNASHTYEFRIGNKGTPNVAPSGFSSAVTVNPIGAKPEAIGTPGQLGSAYLNGTGVTGSFTSAGDLKLNNGAAITATPYPSTPTPTVAPTVGTAADVPNPGAQATLSLVASPGTPATLPTNALAFSQDSLDGLTPGTYYLRYTWQGANGGETVGSAEATVDTNGTNIGGQNTGGRWTPSGTLSSSNMFQLPGEPSNTNFGDLILTIPNAPTNAGNANIYMSTSQGHEQLLGNFAGGAVVRIYGANRGTPLGGFVTPDTFFAGIATNAATVPTSDTTGMAPGTYYVGYTWTGPGGESAPLNAFPEVISGSPADINVTIPAFTGNPTPSAANIYVGTTSTNMRLAGSAAGAGKSLLIKTLPASTAALEPTANTIGMQPGTYYVEYSWNGNYNGDSVEGQPGAATPVTLTSLGDVTVSVPTAPAGAGNANVYVGTTTTDLHLAGSTNANSTMTIRSITTGNRAPNPLNPTAALTTGTGGQVTSTPDVANPVGGLTIASAGDSSGLPAGTYYVEYTYNSANGESAPGTSETQVVLTSASDVQANVTTAPAGVTSINYYIGTTSGGEVRALNGSSVAVNTPLVIQQVPGSGAAAVPTVSQSGLPDGTYYLKYSWVGANGGFSETAASPESSIVLSGGSNDLTVTPPTGIGATNANVFISNASGKEVEAGNVAAGKSLTIKSLPNQVTNRIAPLQTFGSGFATPADVLMITPNVNSQATSAFNPGEDINGFTTSFDFMFNGREGADGFTFTIQPNSQTAVGGGGGALGYDGIGHSVAIYFQQYGSSATGIGINGSRQGAIGLESSGISFSNAFGAVHDAGSGGIQQNESDIYNATLTYNAQSKQLTEVLTDMTKKQLGINAVFTHVYNVNIPQIIGMNNAYVGFTGGAGGGRSEKDILNWTFNTTGAGPIGALSHLIDFNTLPGSANNIVNVGTDSLGDATWTIGTNNFYMPLADTLQVVGNNAADTLNFGSNSALPKNVNLGANTGGSFNLNGLSGDFLAGKSLDIGKNTVYLGYASGSDPIANVQKYLKAGFTNSWAAGTVGGIDSSAVGSSTKLAVGYADSAENLSPDTHPSTIELKYTLYGDATLDGTVSGADLTKVLGNYGKSGTWAQGDSTYDGTVSGADLTKVLGNYGQSAS